MDLDTAAPNHQPSAARSPRAILISIGADTTRPVARKRAPWLDTAQDAACCGRFPPGVYRHRLAATEEIECGAFYELLSYAEYVPSVAPSAREMALAPLATRIEVRARTGGHEDAEPCVVHLKPPAGKLGRQSSPEVIVTQLDRLEVDQPVGGWPTPYDAVWRSKGRADARSIGPRSRVFMNQSIVP